MTDPGNPAQPQPWDAGQPPTYGQPQYGQPAYGQPQSGQPQFGQAQYGQPQFGQPGGPQGTAPKKGNGLVIGLIAAVVVAALAIGGFFLFKGDDSDKDSKGGGSAFTESSATNVVQRFLDDINDQDVDHAKTLVCESELDNFEHDYEEYFGLEFDDITHVSTEKHDDEYAVIYELAGAERGDEDATFDITATIGVVDEDGPKLCWINVTETDTPEEFDEDSATDVARQYLDDVNAEDPEHARTLLCKRQLAGFDKNLASDSHDFMLEFTTISYVSTVEKGDEYIVTFDVAGHSRDDKSDTFDLTIKFGVIDEDGPKICSETAS